MLHFKNILSGLILFSFVLSTEIVQADYQNEIGLYIYQAEDNENDTTDGTSLFYQHYFNNVDTSKGPWAEAAFINRAANIGISASNSESELGTTTKTESSSKTIGGDIASPDSNLVFSASYISSETDYKSSSSTYSSERTGYSLGIGYFIQQYTLVTFDHEETETDYSGLSKPFSYDSEANTIGIKTLILRGNATALVLNALYSVREDSDGDEFKSTLLSANYYLNPRLGVGGNLVKYSNNTTSSGGRSYAIHMNYFISTQIQLGLLYSQYKADNNNDTDSDVVQATGSYYF